MKSFFTQINGAENTRFKGVRWLWAVVGVVGVLGLVGHRAAAAQPVGLKAPPDQIGLTGAVRPGSWAPLLVTLDHRGHSPRRVRCEWVVPDADGDQVYAHRSATLSPQRSSQVWLYAMPPRTTHRRTDGWSGCSMKTSTKHWRP